MEKQTNKKQNKTYERTIGYLCMGLRIESDYAHVCIETLPILNMCFIKN